MTNIFWRAVARICAKPAMRERIIRLGQRTPYRDIISHGELYMRRWWLMPRWCLEYDPEVGALMPKRWLPFSIRLHQIILPDQDRHLHDHPFNFRSLIIDGGYVEERPFAQMTNREAQRCFDKRETTSGTIGMLAVNTGDSYRAPSWRWHRISAVCGVKGAWTIFIMGRRANNWGFLVGRRKVAWRDYLRRFDHV